MIRSRATASFVSAALVALCVAGATASVRADTPTPTLKVNPNTGETQEQFAKRTAWWRNDRFGMFIHWGIYSVPNSDTSNTTHNLTEWYLYENKMQVADYEKFATQFNPDKFDAKAWVAVAKAAGMKYIVVTTKHHDGFCMFDSKLTDYNVVKAPPWHHDPMKDLAAECKRQGITLCFYYSYMDWHHPDYLPRRTWDTRPTTGASLDKYDAYAEGQLKELLTNYGPIGGIWFDGGWEHNAQEEHSLEVDKVIRTAQPGTMINDRLQLPEDYSTPEQTIPARALPEGRLWETCMTINNHWGYAWSDNDWKSKDDLIHKICDIASKGGNFLLNVGPKSDGSFPPEAVERLEAVGQWMKVNGDSIYGTTKSPFFRLPFSGRCTQKGNTLYLQVFSWPDTGLTLPGLQTPVKEARALSGNEKLSLEKQPDGTLRIGKPATVDPTATVIALKLAGPVAVDPASAVVRVSPQQNGTYALSATDADIQGDTAKVESHDGKDNIGYWTDAKNTVSWQVSVPPAKAGKYRIELEYACAADSDGSTYTIQVDGTPSQSITGTVASTGDWAKFTTTRLDDALTLSPGVHTLRIVPQTKPHLAVMNLRQITLIPE